LQPGTISPGQAAQVAARIGGGIAAEDVRGMGGAEIAQIARAAGVPVAEIESVLGQSASGAASGPAAEEVLGVQARRTYENVAAGAMPSTGGPPVAPLASVMTALGGLGLVLRRLSRGG
jgi:hypothetical protein